MAGSSLGPLASLHPTRTLKCLLLIVYLANQLLLNILTSVSHRCAPLVVRTLQCLFPERCLLGYAEQLAVKRLCPCLVNYSLVIFKFLIYFVELYRVIYLRLCFCSRNFALQAIACPRVEGVL